MSEQQNRRGDYNSNQATLSEQNKETGRELFDKLQQDLLDKLLREEITQEEYDVQYQKLVQQFKDNF